MDHITVEPHTRSLRCACHTERAAGRLAVVLRDPTGGHPQVLDSTDDYERAYAAATALTWRTGAVVTTVSAAAPIVVGRELVTRILTDKDNQPIISA